MKSNLFDNWASNYEKDISRLSNSFPFAGYNIIIEEIKGLFLKNGTTKVLDIGIGTGYMLNKVIDITKTDYFGIDFSKKMLKIAEGILSSEKLLCHNITSEIPIEIRNLKFDSILASYALHHFDTPTKFNIINNYSSLLSPNGVFVIADISFDSAKEMSIEKEKAGETWDKEEEAGYFLSQEFIGYLENRNYIVQYNKISFCSAVYIVKKKP